MAKLFLPSRFANDSPSGYPTLLDGKSAEGPGRNPRLYCAG
jgi:hypothetical protein